MKQNIIISTKEDTFRLDSVLVEKLDSYSRSYLQKNIKAGNVKVNGKVVKKTGLFLKTGDVIEIDISSPSVESNTLTPQKMKLDYIYEDNDIVVVNKQSGLVVHPAKGNWDNTLLNGLLFRHKRLNKLGRSPRLGIIHRLDKDTSGTIMVALTERALWHYSQQFEQRKVDKYYIAIVGGDILKTFQGESFLNISNYIGRHPKARKKMSVVNKEKGKLATTKVFLIKGMIDSDLGPISLVLVKLITGRTHQVRVHLSNLGYPIVGDLLYGGLKYKRMMLHAYKIGLWKLDGSYGEFIADIPKDFLSITKMKNKELSLKLKESSEKPDN